MADEAYAAMTKAKNQRDSGNFNGATETLENYLLGDPYNTKVRLLLAEIAFKGGMEDYGMLQLEAILDIYPDNLDALKALMTIQKQNKKTVKEAKKHYEHLLEICPDDPDVLNSYAVFCKYQLLEYKTSEEYYRKAIALNPNNASYHINYAILLVNDLKQYTAGKEEFEKGLALDPSNTKARDAYNKLLKKKFKGEKEKFSISGLFRKK